MNLRFWGRTEVRSQPYSDAIISALAAAAAGNDSTDSVRTSLEEACEGLWARAFAVADVSPTTPATRGLTPEILATIGRNLCNSGESVFELLFEQGQLQLVEASSWTVTGRGRWMYELSIAQPSAIVTRIRDQDSVVHLRYSVDRAQPWIGAGPFQRGATSSAAHKRLERSVSHESNRKAGAVIPVPDTASTSQLQTDLQKLEGKSVLVPSTTTGDWQPAGSQNTGGRSDWNPRRLGPEFTEAQVKMRLQLADHVSASAGVPAALVRGDPDGTALRESWRQFLHSTIQPVAKIIIGELRRKLDTPDLKLSFDSLFASDLSGRARAFQSMVGGGMDVTKAAALAGLMEAE